MVQPMLVKNFNYFAMNDQLNMSLVSPIILTEQGTFEGAQRALKTQLLKYLM